jgi:ankyrin repeat protein
VAKIHFWLSHKADINGLVCKPELTGSNVHMTPLHAALINCHINTMWFLLQNGADIYAPDSLGESVLDLVTNDIEFGHPVIKEMLLQVQRLEY